MFKNVYNSENVKKAEDRNKVEVVIKALYGYFLDKPELMPELYKNIVKEDGTEIAVMDYISGMTDRYAISLYSDLFMPKGWSEY